MFDTALTVSLLIGAAVLSLVSGWRVARSRGGGIAVAVVLLRGAFLLLIAWLLWLACRTRSEKITGKPVDTEEENVVLFLQDLSQSMAFMTAEGRSRGELAEDTWREFKELVDNLPQRSTVKQARSEREPGSAVRRPVRSKSERPVSRVPLRRLRKTALQPSVPGDLPLVPRRMFFARNLVDERDSAKLITDATNTVQAVSACLGREKVRALVIVSDGASTDGAVPEHILDWARNRDVAVYAVCAAAPAGEITDVAVTSSDCPVTNPLRIDVDIACGGRLSGQTGTLELAIDGVPRQTRKVLLREGGTYQLSVPDLERGWHAYAVRIGVERPEITTLNNVAYGVFRVAPAQTVLYLMGRPRPDNPHAVRVLKGLWPERLRVMYAGRPSGGARAYGSAGMQRVEDINIRNVRLAILADVAPEDVPLPLRKAIDKGDVVSMILAGDSLGRWADRGRGFVPLGRAGEVIQLPLGDTDATPGSLSEGAWRYAEREAGAVVAAAAARACGLKGLKLDGVSLDHIHEVKLRSPSQVLLWVKSPAKTYPLLVVDRTAAPRCVVFLTDVAWKWALHPEPKVRAAYGDLWHGLTQWILVEDLATAPLDLSFAPDPKDPDTTLVRVALAGATREPDLPVAPTGREPIRALRNVRLVVAAGGARSTVRPRLKGRAYVFPYTCRKRPRVVWFQAFAEREGTELRSARKPLALPVSNMELLDIKPHPDRMMKYVPGKDSFAYWRDRERVLRRALEIRASRPVEYYRSPEERKTGVEMALALACFLVAACEWLIERRAYAGREVEA